MINTRPKPPPGAPAIREQTPVSLDASRFAKAVTELVESMLRENPTTTYTDEALKQHIVVRLKSGRQTEKALADKEIEIERIREEMQRQIAMRDERLNELLPIACQKAYESHEAWKEDERRSLAIVKLSNFYHGLLKGRELTAEEIDQCRGLIKQLHPQRAEDAFARLADPSILAQLEEELPPSTLAPIHTTRPELAKKATMAFGVLAGLGRALPVQPPRPGLRSITPQGIAPVQPPKPAYVRKMTPFGLGAPESENFGRAPTPPLLPPVPPGQYGIIAPVSKKGPPPLPPQHPPASQRTPDIEDKEIDSGDRHTIDIMQSPFSRK